MFCLTFLWCWIHFTRFTLKISCSGRHTLRVTGVSSLDFRAGFSSVPVTEFNHTRERPIKGVWHVSVSSLPFIWPRPCAENYLMPIFLCPSGLPSHVLLKCTGLKPPGHLSHVELVSGSGRSLRTIPVPLPSDLGKQGLWSLPEFRTPSQSFFIKVTGKDEEGYRFQRLSSVSYTNIIPGKASLFTKATLQCLPYLINLFIAFNLCFLPCADAPAVSMSTVVKGVYMQPAVIGCSVKSDIPYRLRFTRSGITLGSERFFQWVSSLFAQHSITFGSPSFRFPQIPEALRAYYLI